MGENRSPQNVHILTVGVFENLVTTIPIEYLNICSYFLLKPITVFIKKSDIWLT